MTTDESSNAGSESMNLRDELRAIPVPQQKQVATVWEGPESDGPQGGVTQGLLAKWLVCKERARLYLVKGLKQAERFSHKLSYGNMFHLCSEVHDNGGDWREALTKHCQDLFKQWPFDRAEIEKWHDCCQMQFPLCVDFWNKHPNIAKRTSLLQEQQFRVPIKLPSGRTVFLRGKMDAVELVHGGQRPGIVLFETKTKGDIDEQQIRRQLAYDLQVMLYVTALKELKDRISPQSDPLGLEEIEDDFGEALFDNEIVGVRYNVVKRPLSGGKGTIKQSDGTAGAKCTKCKGVGKFVQPSGQWNYCVKCGGAGRTGGKPPETRQAFMARLAQYVKDAPQEWFMRWDVQIMPSDIERFKVEFLVPALENLCDDFEWWQCCHENSRNPFGGNRVGHVALDRRKCFPHHCPRHFRMPFGVTSPLLDGGETDMDVFLNTGSTQGLQHVTNLFPEL